MLGFSLLVHSQNLAPSAGSLFRCGRELYYLTSDMQRHLIPHHAVAVSWGLSTKNALNLSREQCGRYMAGHPVTFKPGSVVLRRKKTGKYYAVSAQRQLQELVTTKVAQDIFGPSWRRSSKKGVLRILPESRVSDYTIGSPIKNAQEYNREKEFNRFNSINAFFGLQDIAVSIPLPTPPIPTPPAPTFASPNITNVNSPLGTNLNAMARWETTFPIIDSFKMSEGWMVNWENDLPLDVDANGWLKSVPKNAQSVDVFIHGHNGEGNFPSGEYVVLYDGEGTITYTGDAEKNEALSKPGRHVIDVKATKGGGIVLQITATDPKKTGNYIKNIRVIHPGGRCGGDPLSYAAKASECAQGNFRSFEQDYDKNILHPQFLQNISAFSIIRPMNFLGIMYNPVGKWSERVTLSSAFWGESQGKTAPLELAFDIANVEDADIWVNMPYHGDNYYVKQAALLAKQRLEPKRNVILEYTNEVWNTAMPYEKGGAWIQQQGEAAWPRSNDDGFHKRLNWFGKRSVEICRIWKQEWGADARRITCTMGGQSGWDYISAQMLDCPIWVANGGKRCADEMDSLAVAPYFGAPFDAKGVEKLRKWMKEPDGGFKSFFDDLESSSGTLQDTKKQMQSNFQVAKQRSLPLIAYEGGQHFLLGYEVNEEPKYTDVHKFLAAVNRHPRMKQAYLKYFQNWKDAGGQLFVHCCAVAASPSIYGYWGLKETQQEERSKAPKFDATMEFIEKNKKWW